MADGDELSFPEPEDGLVEHRAHTAAVDHLEALFHRDGCPGPEECGNEAVHQVEPSSVFDGCLDCIVRETLFAAVPILYPTEPS